MLIYRDLFISLHKMELPGLIHDFLLSSKVQGMNMWRMLKEESFHQIVDAIPQTQHVVTKSGIQYML